MHSLFIASLAFNLHFLCGVLLPGWALRQWLTRRWTNSVSLGAMAIEVAALGSIWATLQFAVLNFAETMGLSSVTMVAATYLSDLLLVLWGWIKTSRGSTWNVVQQAGHRLCSIDILPGIIISVVFGLYAFIQFPYACDNAALYWTASAFITPHLDIFKASQGSPAYIAIMYWPILWAWPMAMPTVVGASAKILLSLLGFFSIKRLCYAFPSISKPWIPPIVFVTVLTTMLGEYGILDTTKESIFATFFMLIAFARLLTYKDSTSERELAMEVGAALSLAIGFGAITVPFIAAFMALWLMMNRRIVKIGDFLSVMGTWVLVPVIFSLAMMLKAKPAGISILLTAGLIVVWLTRSRINQLYEASLRLLDKIPQWPLEQGILLVIIGLDWCLMPVKFEQISFDPLDGKTSLIGMFCDGITWTIPRYVLLLGFIGCLVLSFRRAKRDIDAGALLAFRAFPFATLLVVLLIVHSHVQKLPVPAQNLWDVAKDTRNWCWSVLAVVYAFNFVLEMVGFLASFLDKYLPMKRRISGAACQLLVVLLMAAHLYVLWGIAPHYLRWPEGAYFTKTGGNRNPELAYFSQAIIKKLDMERRNHSLSKAPLLMAVDKEFSDTKRDYDLCGCGVQWSDIDLNNGAPVANPGFVLASRQQMNDWFAKVHPAVSINELESLHSGISLYWMNSAPGSAGGLQTIVSPPFQLAPPSFLWNLSPKLRMMWNDFSPVPMRSKNGHTFLWGNEKGIIWVEVPSGKNWKSSLVVKARFQSQSYAKVDIQSPAIEGQVTLDAKHPQCELKLRSDAPALGNTFYGSNWIPFHFEYNGELLKNPKYGYLQSYSLVKFQVFGQTFLQ